MEGKDRAAARGMRDQLRLDGEDLADQIGGQHLGGRAAGDGMALAQHQAYNLPPQVPAAQLQPLEQQRRQVFERLLTEPGDTDASFAYAVLSTQLGDYEAAIATYERLLIQHPNTARIQLELAAVYFRLGALVQARQLFVQVLQRADTPDNVRLRVNGYLAAIADQRRQQGGFSGRLSVGLRTESNANAAPDIGSIELNGLPFELAPEARAASDQSAQLGLSLRHRQPFAGSAHLLDVAFQAASLASSQPFSSKTKSLIKILNDFS